MRRRIIFALLGFSCLLALCTGQFRSASVCSQCGSIRHTTEMQLPLLPIPYYWSHTNTETPISSLAVQCGVSPQHSHQWVFIQGGGNGITCALGRGGPVAGNANSPKIVAFLTNTLEYRSQDQASQALEAFLDPARAKLARDWLQINEYPDTGFPATKTYEQWRLRADSSILTPDKGF